MTTLAERVDPDGRLVATYRYLEQTRRWLPNGRPAAEITSMDVEWRHNAARWLERNVRNFEIQYAMGEILLLSTATTRDVRGGPALSLLDIASENVLDEMDGWADQRSADPVWWIRTTPLYRALVDGVPMDDAQLVERAKHWSACSARAGSGECCCDEIRAAVDKTAGPKAMSR